MAFAFRELKLVVEPGGAVGLAALLAGRLDVRGKTVVIVLSGGNVDAELFAKLIG
jgi:threonine dehydratase